MRGGRFGSLIDVLLDQASPTGVNAGEGRAAYSVHLISDLKVKTGREHPVS